MEEVIKLLEEAYERMGHITLADCFSAEFYETNYGHYEVSRENIEKAIETLKGAKE
tara:strand:+ start:104 stop:271 length:168 start_codon:yes stop_codon:yes gene_type:complete